MATPCREWRGSRTLGGYGKVRFGPRGEDGRRSTVLLHRWVWEQANGPIPPGLVVRHACDQRACFRLDHLRLGTQADNIDDMVAKRRHARHERSARAKLTMAEVEEIRLALGAGERLVDIAARFGVHYTTISQIKRNITWKDYD